MRAVWRWVRWVLLAPVGFFAWVGLWHLSFNEWPALHLWAVRNYDAIVWTLRAAIVLWLVVFAVKVTKPVRAAWRQGRATRPRYRMHDDDDARQARRSRPRQEPRAAISPPRRAITTGEDT